MTSSPAASDLPGLGAGVWLAAATGLLAGMLQTAIFALRRFGGSAFLGQTPDSVWVTPLLTSALFAVGGAVIWLGVHALRPARRRRAFAFGLLFPLLLTGLLATHGIHAWAIAVLAAGLAATLSLAAAERTAAAQRHARFVTVGGVFVFACVAIGTVALRRWNERAALRSGIAAASGAPTVVLIMLDTVRALSLSLYGYARPTTPFLARLAREGVRFDLAVAPSSWTLPTHASLFTGRPVHDVSPGWERPLPPGPATLAQVLQDRGYVTAGFVANSFYCTWESGLDRGFIHYDANSQLPGALVQQSVLLSRILNSRPFRSLTGYHQLYGRVGSRQIAARVLDWMAGSRRPAFLFLNYFDAHSPYQPGAPFDTAFGSSPPRQDPMLYPSTRWTPEGLRAEQDYYDRSILGLDQSIGELFDALRSRGALDNAIVIVMADHGDEFREHGATAHGHNLYLTTTHVPLVIWAPGRVPAGTIVTQPVSLQDVAATVLDLAGLSGGELPGTSLARTWQAGAGAASAAPVLSELYVYPDDPLASIRFGKETAITSGRWHYVNREGGGESLFDVRDDPLERQDLAHAREFADTLAGLRALAARLGGTQKGP